MSCAGKMNSREIYKTYVSHQQKYIPVKCLKPIQDKGGGQRGTVPVFLL